LVRLSAIGGPSPFIEFTRMPKVGELVDILHKMYRIMHVSDTNVLLVLATCVCGGALDVRGKCGNGLHK
jgi:hypothetical protein